MTPISMPICRLVEPNGKHVLTFHHGQEGWNVALTKHLMNNCVFDGFYYVLHAVINTPSPRPHGEMVWRKRTGKIEIASGRICYNEVAK